MEEEKPQQVETAPVPEEKPKEESPTLSEQFQRIAKQEKHLNLERNRLEESRKTLEADRALADNYKSLKGKNPFEILSHFGVTYEQLIAADKERNSPLDPNVRAIMQKQKELESRLADKDKEAAEAKAARAEIQLKASIDTVIKEKEYDIIDKLDAKDAVREYMEEVFNTTGEIPTVEKACEEVTNYLVEKYNSVRDSKWLQSKEVEKPVIEPVAKKESIPSISNKMSQTTEYTNMPMSDADRLKAAIAVMTAMKGKA